MSSGGQELGLRRGRAAAEQGEERSDPFLPACPTPTSWETDPGALKVTTTEPAWRSLWEAAMENSAHPHAIFPLLLGLLTCAGAAFLGPDDTTHPAVPVGVVGNPMHPTPAPSE